MLHKVHINHQLNILPTPTTKYHAQLDHLPSTITLQLPFHQKHPTFLLHLYEENVVHPTNFYNIYKACMYHIILPLHISYTHEQSNHQLHQQTHKCLSIASCNNATISCWSTNLHYKLHSSSYWKSHRSIQRFIPHTYMQHFFIVIHCLFFSKIYHSCFKIGGTIFPSKSSIYKLHCLLDIFHIRSHK